MFSSLLGIETYKRTVTSLQSNKATRSQLALPVNSPKKHFNILTMRFLSVSLLFLGVATSISARALSERRSSSLKDCKADPSSVVQKQVFTSVDGQSLTATTYACADSDDSTSFDPRALPLELAARQNIEICSSICKE